VGLTQDEIERFLAEKRNIVVAAIRKDGRPQMTPTWFHWEGGRFYVSMSKDSHKYRNLLRDPRVQLLVDDTSGYKTVIVDGVASFIEGTDEMMPWARKVRGKHGLEPETDDAMRERIVREQRVVLVVTPDKPPEQWVSWS